jgi:hypothetical protein
MKLGIISDIHANLEALEAILRALDQHKIDMLICLGDIVGYGPDPQACCDIIRKNAKVTLLGNHDAAVADRMDYSCYRLAARKALDGHKQSLSAENIDWLKGLPYINAIDQMGFCHASPVDYQSFKYVFGLDQMGPLIGDFIQQPFVTFIGHSHLCKCFFYHESGADEILNTRFHLVSGYKYLLTVGSVGQPRDQDPRACCGVYDSKTGEFEYIRVPYDIQKTAKKIIETEYLADTFGHRLFLGI